MTLIKCHECNTQISKNAKACPKCGAAPRSSIILRIFSAIVLCIIIFSFTEKSDKNGTSSEEQKPSRCEDSAYAAIVAQDEISEALVAPATADFPNVYEIRRTYLGECTHQITGWVDAQNSFGANVRSYYTIQLAYNETTKSWHGVPLAIKIDSSRSAIAVAAIVMEKEFLEKHPHQEKVAPADGGVNIVHQAASFDCKQARSALEILICADPELSSLDGKVGELYLQAISAAADNPGLKSQLLQEQRAFLKNRLQACPVPLQSNLSNDESQAIISCLSTQYRLRKSALLPIQRHN